MQKAILLVRLASQLTPKPTLQGSSAQNGVAAAPQLHHRYLQLPITS
jgi:hypothetical protein